MRNVVTVRLFRIVFSIRWMDKIVEADKLSPNISIETLEQHQFWIAELDRLTSIDATLGERRLRKLLPAVPTLVIRGYLREKRKVVTATV